MTNTSSFLTRLAGLALLLAAPGLQAQEVAYYHTDALGSVVAVTDQNRNVIEKSEYEPYGYVTNHPPTDGPGYTGHVLDALTGMNYMQQRYYDPVIGRFLSRDPVTADPNTGANFNAYWYAANNPYKFVDPDGRANKLGIEVKIDEYSPAFGKSLTGQDQAAVSAAQQSVDLTVDKVLQSGTDQQKSSLSNWSTTIDPSVQVAPGSSGNAMANTIYQAADESGPENISTIFAGSIVNAANPSRTNSSNGMVAKGGDPALLMVGAHEFVGHGNASNAALSPGPQSENDARTRTWELIKGTSGVECIPCERTP